jgi:hypothetical protein
MPIERDFDASDVDFASMVHGFDVPRAIAQPDPHIGCDFKQPDD